MGCTGFMKSTGPSFLKVCFQNAMNLSDPGTNPRTANRRGFVGLAHFKDGSAQDLGYLMLFAVYGGYLWTPQQ